MIAPEIVTLPLPAKVPVRATVLAVPSRMSMPPASVVLLLTVIVAVPPNWNKPLTVMFPPAPNVPPTLLLKIPLAMVTPPLTAESVAPTVLKSMVPVPAAVFDPSTTMVPVFRNNPLLSAMPPIVLLTPVNELLPLRYSTPEPPGVSPAPEPLMLPLSATLPPPEVMLTKRPAVRTIGLLIVWRFVPLLTMLPASVKVLPALAVVVPSPIT